MFARTSKHQCIFISSPSQAACTFPLVAGQHETPTIGCIGSSCGDMCWSLRNVEAVTIYQHPAHYTHTPAHKPPHMRPTLHFRCFDCRPCHRVLSQWCEVNAGGGGTGCRCTGCRCIAHPHAKLVVNKPQYLTFPCKI